MVQGVDIAKRIASLGTSRDLFCIDVNYSDLAVFIVNNFSWPTVTWVIFIRPS